MSARVREDAFERMRHQNKALKKDLNSALDDLKKCVRRARGGRRSPRVRLNAAAPLPDARAAPHPLTCSPPPPPPHAAPLALRVPTQSQDAPAV